jgi:hypothetical protein
MEFYSGESGQSGRFSEGVCLRRVHKRQHEPPRIVGDLLTAEISEKLARSIVPLR